MIKINFKNLESSSLLKEAAIEKVKSVMEKFPNIKTSNIKVLLEMENSPLQAGPDLFKVKIHIENGYFSGVTLEKNHSNIYVALAEVTDNMLERLNRFGDKKRVKERKNTLKKMEVNFA